MKKIFSIILAVALIVAFSGAVMANDEVYMVYIADETGVISDDDLYDNNKKAQDIYNTYNYNVCFLMINNPGDLGTVSYAENEYTSSYGNTNGIMLLVTDDEWYIYFSGDAQIYFAGTDEEIWNYSINANTYSELVGLYLEKISTMLADFYPNLAPSQSTQFYGTDEIPSERLMPRLVDEGELLSDSEEGKLLSLLDEISERQQVDVVVITTSTLEGYSAMAYADDIYDYCGYGMGSSRDGILLLVSMEDRDWWVSTCGYGIISVTDAGLDAMSDMFVPYLSSGDYLKAFSIFANQCDDYITQAKSGSPYDGGNLPKGQFDFLKKLGIAAVIGLVAGAVVVTILYSQLKSVSMNNTAAEYIRSGSMQITDRRDIFRNKQVFRTAKPKDSGGSSGGGSSTHISSSGSSHGGGGGKF